jgi:CHAT domain-containing protein
VVRAALTSDQARILVDRVRASVDWASRGQQPFDFAAAGELSAKLLQPIDAQLAGVRTLKVVADGPLASLPFALLLRRAGGSDPASAAWLMRDMAVSVLPSVGALAELRQGAGASRAKQSFIGFGAPGFTGAEAAMASRANTQCRDGKTDRDLVRALAPLPETAKELDRIAGFLKAPKGSVVLGPQATKTNLQSKNLADFRVLAFATHGLLSGELPCQNEPALALTPPAKAGDDGGILAASEIARLRLDADWVLLSACNTAGPNGAHGGQALSGLVRAFLYAGSRAVLATHWSVASEPTVQLTTQTFKAFGEGGAGRAEALRQAQLAMLQNPATAHPVFWAPFVVVGEGAR